MNQPDPSLPPIREFADRGIKWLLESPENVGSLLAVVAPDLARALDLEHLTAVPASMIPDSLRKQEADLVFRVPFRTGARPREVLVYLLIEHQSSPDAAIVLRVLLYMCGLWDRQYRQWVDRKGRKGRLKLLPVIPYVFYTGSGRWEMPLSLAKLMDLPEGLARFVPEFELLFLNLKAAAPEQVTAQGDTLGWLLRMTQEEEAPKTELEAALEGALEHLRALPLEQRSKVVKAAQYMLLLLYYKRDRGEAEELAAKVLLAVQEPEVKAMGRTYAQELLEEGMDRGRQEGRQDILLRLLEAKFGRVPPELVERIHAISDGERLSALIPRVLSANTLEAIGL